jgi:hypothetical protein
VEHGPAAGPRRGQAALAAALLAALAGAAVAVAGDEDTASWERGKQLYTRGESASRRIVTADVQRGAPPVPASILPCVHCHGPDGRGKGDQAVAAPDIRWRALAGRTGRVTRSGGAGPSTRRALPAPSPGVSIPTATSWMPPCRAIRWRPRTSPI